MIGLCIACTMRSVGSLWFVGACQPSQASAYAAVYRNGIAFLMELPMCMYTSMQMLPGAEPTTRTQQAQSTLQAHY